MNEHELSVTQLFSVTGRVAVVTGGSSGLGLMIAKGFVVNGVKTYVVALPTDPIDVVVQELNTLGQESGGMAIGIACDLSSKDNINQLVGRISQTETQIDILVSNAGIRRDPLIKCNDLFDPSVTELQASMWSSPESDWADSFRINTVAHYFLSVAFLPLLSAAAGDGRGSSEGRGVVVITSSCASMHNATNVDLTSYAASKAATDHLVRLLAAKFRQFYVRVNSINPGFVPSNMNPVGQEGNIFANLFDQVPARRAGCDADVAGAVLYLVSRAGAYVDGINLVVDGGRLLVANGQR